MQAYLNLRGNGGGEGKTITATARQLESLIRLSEARAKIRLSECVSPSLTLAILTPPCMPDDSPQSSGACPIHLWL